MDLIIILVVCLIFVFVMVNYARSIKERKNYEDKQAEVLDSISNRIAYQLMNQIQNLKFEDDYSQNRILISGPFKATGVEKVANKIISIIQWYEEMITPLYDQYHYEPKHSILSKNEIIKIKALCNDIINRRQAMM